MLLLKHVNKTAIHFGFYAVSVEFSTINFDVND